MWASLAFGMLKAAYWAGGRDIIKSAVDDPAKTWDDKMMSALDTIMRK